MSASQVLTGSQLVELQRRYIALTKAIDAVTDGGEVQGAPEREAEMHEAYQHFQALASELMPSLMDEAADGIKARERTP